MKETNIFKVLADSQRRDILIMLRSGRLNAGEIADKLQITPAALSYHLKLLKGADLIAEYKEKNFIYYEILQLGFLFQLLFVFITQRKEILTNGKCNKRNETDKLEKRNIY